MEGRVGPVVSTVVPSSVPLTCTALLPGRIVLNRPTVAVPVSYRPDCSAAGASSASWWLTTAAGARTAIASLPSTTAQIPDSASVGAYQWRPDGATTGGRVALSQNTVGASVRYGAAVWLGVGRSGNTVSVSTFVNRYQPALDRYGQSTPSSQAQLQYRLADGSWKTVKYLYPTATQAYRWSYTCAVPRTYRVLLPDAPAYWGTTSASVTR
ncbi:MAG: hypothetical protein LWW86_02435 [Micrococcales bacterium]|nr:hypothetical protein [Micrococcales bacterium]